MPSRTFWLSSAAVLLAIASAVTTQSFQGSGISKAADSVSATYAGGLLRASIPYTSSHAGAGLLTIEVLNPEDEAVARTERRTTVSAGTGLWRGELRFAKPVPTDELVWHRLRYRFTYDEATTTPIHGLESISEILRMPMLRIIGQQTWLNGAPAAVRVIVSDSKNDPIAGAGSVKIRLRTPDGKSLPLYSGAVNSRGTAEAVFRAPAGLTGTFPVEYIAETRLGSAEFTQQVRLEDQVSTLLTTEKPIYQPGQTIHVRALALNRASHEAMAARKLTFELEDSRGNKIFRQTSQTSKFGVASAEFSLADEVNLGTWHLRALLENKQASEIALNIERYVLPKFKVAVDFAGNDQKAKRGYRPGDHVTGTVRANYFFGKAVDRAEITVAASAADIGVAEVASVHGITDNDGAYHFDLRLPDYFAGKPLDHGVARVLIEARVKDNAAHTESRGESITVSESPLILTAFPEGGKLIPNLENRVFVLASYPDGSPASADVAVEATDNPVKRAATDAGGVAIVEITARQNETLKISAADKEGNHGTASVNLDYYPGLDQILLRTERAIYKAGDRIQLKVFSTKKTGAAYVDIIKDGQTIVTRDVDLVNGSAEFSVPATTEMSGTLGCNAYLFGANGQPVGDHRLVFVQPADELRVQTTADAAEYKPGGEARVRFKVTNSRGEGVQAAIGVQAVDEAVFALAEKQPGFAKVFFYLEQEAMKPRYEIHSIGLPDIVTRNDQQDRAALALFSATEMTNTNRFEGRAGESVQMGKLAEYRTRYQSRFMDQVNALAEALNRAYKENSEGGDVMKVAARLEKNGAPELRDAWDQDFILQPVMWIPQRKMFMVRGMGAGRMGEFAAYLGVNGAVYGTSSGIQVAMEHDRGAVNGVAEITGKVVDSTGAVVPGATIDARAAGNAVLQVSPSDREGRFTLSGIQPGEYEVLISSPGFAGASTRLKLAARDRAVLSATLHVGAMTETVTVNAEAPLLKAETGDFTLRINGLPGGVAGGGMGGVIGGVPVMAQAINGRFVAAGNAIMRIQGVDRIDAVFQPAPHTRSWFPEALYINPEIITDQDGSASITIPIADSITTWRMAMLASTTHGTLGSGSANIKVFQDFFTDLDLPVTLTQGDRVSIPVAIYNYTGASGDVKLQLAKADWYSLVADAWDKNVAVESGRVGASQFTIEAARIGKFKLTLSAHIAGHADIVVREIEVIPNGREKNIVFNGRLESFVDHQVNFPADAIPDANKLFVRLYPGPLSQVIEGMDAILRMPGGCFEQTSSSTYPNVLALDYMKRTKKLTPEVHAKAEGFIANGYQRLLTFEVPGGGFSWFGQAPANKILTAYGLMEFFDMAQVHDVDPNVISRTQQWLAGQQQPDGSWKPDSNFINEGATNRYNSDLLRITAYIAWALENTGYRGPAVEKAREYVEKNMNAKADAYTKAVIANFAADSPDSANARSFTAHAAQVLLDARTEKDDQIWWTAEETGVFGRGDSAAIETTGLALQALLKWGEASGQSRKALAYISAKKDASGAWGTTQATIMALRALLLASTKGGGDVSGTVEVTLNGTPVQRLVITPDNNDLLHQFTLDAKPSSAVGIRFTGKGGLAYQVVGRYFVPWDVKPEHEALSIDVAYDRARLAQDDIATATATVHNNLGETANMVMIDLGIPPGFDLLTEDLQDYQAKTSAKRGGRLEKFSLTATQAMLYFDSIGARDTVTVRFRLRAKYPIRARTFQSRVYEYYQPEVNSIARPVQLEVYAKGGR